MYNTYNIMYIISILITTNSVLQILKWESNTKKAFFFIA